jgi:hypothetical protein
MRFSPIEWGGYKRRNWEDLSQKLRRLERYEKTWEKGRKKDKRRQEEWRKNREK